MPAPSPLFLAYWVDNFSPFVVRFTDNFGIRYYGLAYLLGFITGGWLLYRYACAGRSLVPAAKVADLVTALVIGVLIGGRLGSYLLYGGWQRFHTDPLEIFRVWEGGMASHGGMIGVALALAWFARANKIPFLHLGDLIVSVAPAGLFFGRIANFINGELWGKITRVPWAVIFPLSEQPGTPVKLMFPRHPSQLYEAALEGALLFAYLQWRFWKSDAVRTRPGRLSGEFFVGYALVRIFCEIFREPDEGVSLIFGLSRGTFYSLFLIVIGAGLILRRGQPIESDKKLTEPRVSE
ncbi:MAG TPA: prolipoprotein diacylglyceryl transferase [Opitutaceae bacterium]|jgi:phosphatidylglycerol:prolipoprotein diacylglycerol transferase|nr:prolipoprotein diacylglyceryl transferase [Opitutaceae bacterium]